MKFQIKRVVWCWVAAVVLSVGLFSGVSAAVPKADDSAAPVEKHKTGHLEVTVPGVPAKVYLQLLSDYRVRVDPAQVAEARSGKLKWIHEPKRKEYTYVLDVPAGYKAGTPFGVLMFVNPSADGGVPRGYVPLLAKHHLIGVGAKASGNAQDTAIRQGLAVYAVDVVRERYSVDPDRVYIAGMSGGGRLTSHAVLMNSDVFTGGVCLCGADGYAKLGVPGKPGWTFGGFWPRPDPVKLGRAKQSSRIVFVEGSNDFNRSQAQAVYATYKTQFRYVDYVEQQGLGHGVPSAETFEKGLKFLDAPLAAEASRRLSAAGAEERGRQLGRALADYTAAMMHGDEATSAKARPHFEELRKKYDEELAKVQTAVDGGNRAAASHALVQFHREWGSMAAADVERLREKALHGGR